MRTWSIFWNSEQYVHLSLYGDNLFWTIQQFSVCVNPPVLFVVHHLEFCCCCFSPILPCRFVWAKMPRRRATWWRWQPWTTKEKPSPCPSPTFTSTVCPWYSHHPDSISRCVLNLFRCLVSFSRQLFLFLFFLINSCRWAWESLSWKPQWPLGWRLGQDQSLSAACTS